MTLTSVYSRHMSRCRMSGGSELEQKVAAERTGGVTHAHTHKIARLSEMLIQTIFESNSGI